MKKYLFLSVLIMALLVSGCSEKVTPPAPTESIPVSESTAPETTVETTEETTPETTVETTAETTPSYDISQVDAYLASVKETSEEIRHYLEFEAMSQLDMNTKSQELYDLWDEALNYLWGELKSTLPEEEFAPLLEEQRTWITDKEAAVAEAGQEAAGGSLYPLIVNSKAANLTEERVYRLYEILKNA